MKAGDITPVSPFGLSDSGQKVHMRVVNEGLGITVVHILGHVYLLWSSIRALMYYIIKLQ